MLGRRRRVIPGRRLEGGGFELPGNRERGRLRRCGEVPVVQLARAGRLGCSLDQAKSGNITVHPHLQAASMKAWHLLQLAAKLWDPEAKHASASNMTHSPEMWATE